MALNTNIALRSKSIYQISIKHYSRMQNFKGVINDLDRIKNMGFDIICLLPIHPIGIKNKKGTNGSPYSISNYYEIHELYGNLKDFEELALEIKKKGMLLMLDIVINHTSRDSKLLSKHPNWFYKNDKGEIINKVEGWDDIFDLDFSNKKLRDYLIEMLKYWANYVDGFRCDAATLIPIDFWKKARRKVFKINEKLIWLAETGGDDFVKQNRDLGFQAASDSQIYEAFDACYDYDIYRYMDEFLKGNLPLLVWLDKILTQEGIYPANYVKIRSFENHDQPRLLEKVKDKKIVIQLFAMQFFLRGMPFIYAGGEFLPKRRPHLFEDEFIEDFKEESIEDLITRLNQISKDEIMIDGIFNLEKKDFAIFSYQKNERYLLGIFNLENKNKVEVKVKDGKYQNLINEELINVKNGIISNLNYPIIISVKSEDIKK